MKKLKQVYDYKFGAFIDYKGLKHHITLCALSQELPIPEEIESVYRELDDGQEINNLPDIYGVSKYHLAYGEDACYDLVKSLSIGYSVCNPEDTYNEEYGKVKAKAVAEKAIPIIWSTQRGCISTKLVRALLENEMDYIINNPDQIIKGYSEAKDRFEKKSNAHLEYSQLEGGERVVARFMKEDPKRARELALLVKSL